MILADTNFWLAISISTHGSYHAAMEWFSEQGSRSILFCRATQNSFLRLITTESVVRHYGAPALTNAQAWRVYEGLILEKRVGWAAEPSGTKVESIWRGFSMRDTPSPKLWMDSYLAAFAIAGGYRFVTLDQAFSQYKGLDLICLGETKVL